MILSYISLFISFIALGVSLYSVWFNWTNRKEDFLKKLRDDILEVEKIFITLQSRKNFDGLKPQDLILLEDIRFKLLYQHSEKEKKRYLSSKAYTALRQLHEMTEDNFGNILSGIDPVTHRDQTINALKNFLILL